MYQWNVCNKIAARLRRNVDNDTSYQMRFCIEFTFASHSPSNISQLAVPRHTF